MITILKSISKILLKDEFSIQQRLMHIVLATALVGTFLSMISSLFIGVGVIGTLVTVVVIFFVLFTLYLSAIKRKADLAAILVLIVADMAFLTLLFFTSGGIYSGMPIWFLLGLSLPWFMISNEKYVYTLYVLIAFVFSGSIYLSVKYPDLVIPLDSLGMRSDIIASIVIVSLIFGSVFHFQGKVYKKQNLDLENSDKELKNTLKQLESALESLNDISNAKSSFLARMSHEIRTPINAVLGMGEIIYRESGNAEIKKYALNIRNSGNSLLAIINDILDFSKIESGKMEIMPDIYNVSSVLNDCYNMVSLQAKKKNLQFIVINDKNLPGKLYGDEYRIRQIITNLLSNAVKYTKIGYIVFNIQCERIDDKHIILLITVKDTGAGIAKENLDKLFETFRRFDERKNKGIEGTGLGLSITRQLITLMNGSVTVESKVGQGTKFCIRIPQIVVSNEPVGDFYRQVVNAEDSDVSEETFVAPNVHILVVDDMQVNLDVIKGLLKRTEMHVDVALSGTQALSLLKNKKYDLILLDHVMPEMDGVETLRQMRLTENGKNVPVIALTANALQGAKEEYMNLGFSDYLSKPVKGIVLEKIVLSLLPKEKVNIVTLEQINAVNNTNEDLIKSDESKQSTLNSKENSIQKPLLERLDFIDAYTGLLYCANDKNLYKDVLECYVKTSRIEDLQSTFAKEDWDNYRIQVHSLKSSSLTIGAKDVAEQARLLEQSVLDKDFNSVLNGHTPLMNAYTDLLDKLSKALNMA